MPVFCSNCGKEHRDTLNFCINCAKSLHNSMALYDVTEKGEINSED